MIGNDYKAKDKTRKKDPIVPCKYKIYVNRLMKIISNDDPNLIIITQRRLNHMFYFNSTIKNRLSHCLWLYLTTRKVFALKKLMLDQEERERETVGELMNKLIFIFSA